MESLDRWETNRLCEGRLNAALAMARRRSQETVKVTLESTARKLARAFSMA